MRLPDLRLEVPYLEPGMYRVEASNDGEQWDLIEAGIVVVGDVHQIFQFEQPAKNRFYQYWRIVPDEEERNPW